VVLATSKKLYDNVKGAYLGLLKDAFLPKNTAQTKLASSIVSPDIDLITNGIIIALDL